MNRGQTFGELGANFVVALQRQKRNMALPTVRMPKEPTTEGADQVPLKNEQRRPRSSRGTYALE